MIQRIQSIYLFVTAILMAVTVFSPLCIISIADTTTFQLLTTMGLEGKNGNIEFSTIALAIISGVTAFISLITIFLFRNRPTQIKLCYVNILLILLFYVSYYYYVSVSIAELEGIVSSFKYGSILPAISIIFILLASIQIKKDDKLVKSLNRIR